MSFPLPSQFRAARAFLGLTRKALKKEIGNQPPSLAMIRKIECGNVPYDRILASTLMTLVDFYTKRGVVFGDKKVSLMRPSPG